ncbi:MAG: alpha-N-arabinofuranosidase [Anaerolineae bacterium]
MNCISIDLQRTLGSLDRNVFGGFAEHLERCIYGGIFDPDSPHADERGLRTDVIAALRRLRMPVIRYPGGNFVSGYRWEDGVGPRDQRPARLDLAWHTVESNQFGTNEFIDFCRLLGTEPYLVVNCGDGSMREARDWVEYCNGTQNTALVKLRRQHGYEAPHKVKYWGIGNEVDGPWQIGFKTPQEYARAVTEFGKVMKWVDPDIKLIANGVSHWDAADFVERGQLLLEQAGHLIDYLAIHWYVDNDTNDFKNYMALSELFEERLSAYEGLIRALRLERKIKRPIYIAVDEWNVWHRSQMAVGGHEAVLYTLEDALVVAMQLNAFLRHAQMVKMANIAQIVNVIAPIVTHREGLFLQTIFYVFEAYSTLAGPTVLDIHWDGETFSGGGHQGLRILDVVATLDANRHELVVFIVNRSEQAADTVVKLAEGQFSGPMRVHTITGPHVKACNSFDDPDQVKTAISTLDAAGTSLTVSLPPHSFTALVCAVD